MRSLNHTLRLVDVTAEMRRRVQGLLDGTCNKHTLGQGRDMAHRSPPYSRLVVSKVTRIESPAIWRKYAAQRETMRDQLRGCHVPVTVVQTYQQLWMAAELDASVNEKYLWHGTKPELPDGTDLIDIIEKNGFDERVGALSGMFGAGVYFADMCSKSDQYCTPRRGGRHFYLFLSRVMLGVPYGTTRPMQQTRRPPLMAGVQGRPHDSITYTPRPGSANGYREFIVYDKAQTYPEYLVEYERAP
jgi:hypothetical protein